MIFDLLFILLFLLTVGTLLTAGWLALRRQGPRARKILFRWLVAAGVYITIVIAVSLALPRRVLQVGSQQCFDDWCVAIAGFQRTPQGAQVTYRVDLRLSSRARRKPQRETNLVVYLSDAQDQKFAPTAEGSAGAFDVMLEPQQSVIVSRSFSVPANANGLGFVITHEGGFPIGWFIIGYDTWFRKPPILPLS